jgi:phosphatidylglycerophosphate synthase
LKAERNRVRLRRVLRRLGIAQLTDFVWERGLTGLHHNPEGMRAVVRAGFLLTGAAWIVDLSIAAALGMNGFSLILLAQGLWIAAVIGVILLNIGFLAKLDGTVVTRLGLANQLTLARVALLPMMAALILQCRWVAALIGYLAIALSDVVDGIVARRRHEETRLGFVLDPLGDILFQIAVFASLFARDRIESWTLAAVLVRYGLLIFGCIALFLLQGRIWIRPTPFGRVTGVALGAGTVLLLYGPLSGWKESSLATIERVIAILFAAGAVHVLMIGWANFRRPAAEGYGDWKRWGLRISRDRDE